MISLPALKASLDFRALVRETHEIGLNGKIRCPYHEDSTPSCHIYPDGFRCYGCGVYGDHIDWLEHVYSLDTAAAIARLKERGGEAPQPRKRPQKRHRLCTPRALRTFVPPEDEELKSYRQRLGKLTRLPGALESRGFTLTDARRLGVVAVGEDALFPIYAPDGRILALKRRLFCPKCRMRYHYTTSGHGSPAWCSPAFMRPERVLVLEGELNAMITYLALDSSSASVAVMGAAGAQAPLHTEALRGRQVFVQADADAAGEKAIERWVAQAKRAGASEVFVLPLLEQDACEVAGSEGKGVLAARTLGAMLECLA